jgi:hypothetical protein
MTMRSLPLILIGFILAGLPSVAQTSPSWNQVTSTALSQAAVTRIGSASQTLLFNRQISVSENITIPSNIKLMFSCDGGFNIATGVVLTIDSEIIADHKQIFFGDGSVTCTPRVNSSASTARYSGEIKPAWWGAVNDGVYPVTTEGEMPGGTDSTAAFQKAAAFAANANTQISNLTAQWAGQSIIKIVLEPGANYVVSGDNVMGFPAALASTRNSVTWWVEGNGANFFWTPANADDAFFNNAQHFWTGTFRNFNILTCGFTGTRGIIYNCQNVFVAPSTWVGNSNWNHWYNVRVEHGHPSNVATRYAFAALVFRGTGNGGNDELLVERCVFRDVKILYSENAESVLPTFRKCFFDSWVDDMVFFEYTRFYSHLLIDTSHVGMKANNQTFIKADSTGVSIDSDTPAFIDTAPSFSILATRFEGSSVSSNTYNIVDANFGKFVFDEFDISRGGANFAAGHAAKVRGTAVVRFTNSRLHGKIRVEPRLSLAGLRSAPYGVIIDGSSYDTSLYDAGIEWYFPDTTTTYNSLAKVYRSGEATASIILLPAIKVSNPVAGSNGISAVTYAPPGVRQSIPNDIYRARLGIASGSVLTYATGSVRLPGCVLITKAEVTAGGTSLAGMRMVIGTSVLFNTDTVSFNATGTKGVSLFDTDIYRGIYLPSDWDGRQIRFEQYDGASYTFGVGTPCYVDIEYQPIGDIDDLPAIGANLNVASYVPIF